LGKGFGLKKAGLHLVELLPIGQSIISHDLPVYYTRSGIYVLKDAHLYESALYEAEDFHFIRYQDIVDITADGKDVKINGKRLIKTPSPVSARYMADHIQDLKRLKPSKRNNKVRSFLAEATDLQGIKGLRSDNNDLLFYLRILSWCLFVFTFLVLPLALYSKIYVYVNLTPLLV